MAIYHSTPPLGGGERPRLPSAQVGPVTQAIRAMRAPTWHLHARDIRALCRTEVEDLIGGLIDLLDAMDGDTDRELEVADASAAEWPGRGTHRFNVGEIA